MPVVIKLVNAETPGPDLFLSTASPPVWDALPNAQTYSTVYAAIADASRVRDGQAGFPPSTSGDRIVIWDQTSGAEYHAPRLSELI